MRNGLLPALLAALVVAACAREESHDYIVYRPPVERVDGAPVSRILLVTPERGALLVLRRFDDVTRVVAARVSRSDWNELRRQLARTRYFPSEAFSRRESPPTFLIRGRLGQIEVDLERDPVEPVEAEVVDARSVLESILGGMPAEGDPVASAAGFLSSPGFEVRGQAVSALLAVRDDELRDAGVREEAKRILDSHREVEEDRRIVDRIRRR